ncbi:cytochrome c oxidase assembly protein [Roseomonas sp. SSH11]|uniref:Cytochrome c oxidase assembly protein n=1 Tax=Pararoseomonas baculiformis TaxID=2820812 RepID=A0ABS4AD15_9PROT|nr:cytochrome c oxidase assembly protein [Pararoseomonas baculiformis]MBP0444430.1 cytochrome c oxidase assembly protein [Pararoseomonas baculiformis]
MTGSDAVPFCGLPPLPGDWAWNLDPLLLAILAGGLALGWRAGGNRPLFLAGWALLALALVSPLCSLAVALFSVRVGQHLILMLVAAPLLAMGLRPRTAAPAELAGSAAVFAVILWFWHLPAPYAWTFVSDGAWWAMHASLFASAVWLWHGAMRASRADAALLSGLATAAQMGALGAFLTFAPRPLFAPHALSTLPWGLTPLEDQQLGGLLMWVPGGTAFAALALFALSRALGAMPDRLKT